MGKYFTGGMHLVYLDQCVISRLIDKPENNRWQELRAALFHGHARRNVLCPTSLEHLVETSAMMVDADAIRADEIMRSLCSGWSLAIEPRLVARQIFCAVQGVKMSRVQFLQKNLWQPLSHPGTLNQLRALRTQVDTDNAWRVQGVNEINALARNGKGSDAEVQRIITQRMAEADARKLMEAVVEAIVLNRAEVLAAKHNPVCRDWPSTIVYTLAHEHRFRLPDLKKLHAKLEQEGISFIPTQRIKGELQAYQFAHREKVEPRDQYDLTRIACALPYADVLITDGGKAHALRELRLDKEFGTEVFSMKERELPALVARLHTIAGA